MRTRRLNQRLETLEREFVREPAMLTMPDGSTETIPGKGEHLLNLMGCVHRGATPEEAAQLDLIRRSTDSSEPGGGRMIELIRALLLGPAETGANRVGAV
jgi:hypothetical protein